MIIHYIEGKLPKDSRHVTKRHSTPPYKRNGEEASQEDSINKGRNLELEKSKFGNKWVGKVHRLFLQERLLRGAQRGGLSIHEERHKKENRLVGRLGKSNGSDKVPIGVHEDRVKETRRVTGRCSEKVSWAVVGRADGRRGDQQTLLSRSMWRGGLESFDIDAHIGWKSKLAKEGRLAHSEVEE